MSPLFLLAAILLTCGCVLGDEKGLSKCDKAIINKVKDSYPDGMPEDLLSMFHKNGPHSYVQLSQADSKMFSDDDKAGCVAFVVIDGQTIKLIKKLGRVTIETTYTCKYYSKAPIPYMTLMGLTDVNENKKAYTMSYSDGVGITYWCNNGGKGSGISVGVFVADRLKHSPETKAALTEAMKKVNDMNLGDDLVPLDYCSNMI